MQMIRMAQVAQVCNGVPYMLTVPSLNARLCHQSIIEVLH